MVSVSAYGIDYPRLHGSSRVAPVILPLREKLAGAGECILPFIVSYCIVILQLLQQKSISPTVGTHEIGEWQITLLGSLDWDDVHSTLALIVDIVLHVAVLCQFFSCQIGVLSYCTSHQLDDINRGPKMIQVVRVLHIMVLLFYIDLAHGLVLCLWDVLMTMIVASDLFDYIEDPNNGGVTGYGLICCLSL